MSRRVPGWVFSALVAAGAMLVSASQPLGGISLWTLWQIRAAQSAADWARTGAEWSPGAFGGDGVFPIAPILVSWMPADVDALVGLRWWSAMALALLVFGVSELGRRGGGLVGAVVGVGALAASPRVWAMVAEPGGTLLAAAALVMALYTVLRTREHGAWLLPAAVALAATLLASLHGWWMLAGLAVLLFISDEPWRPAGRTLIAPASPAMLAVLPLAVLFVVAAHPGLHSDTADRLGDMLELWLKRPAEPFLVAGELFGPERVPIWAVPLVQVITTPVALWFAAVAAIVLASGETGRTTRETVFVLVWGWVGIVVLRSPFHAGIDLLGVLAPLVAVLAGHALGQLVQLQHVRATLGLAIGALVLAAASAEALTAAAAPRAFYSALIGGTGGAADAGFSRAPHAPLDLALLGGLAVDRPVALAVVSNAWEFEPVLRWYVETGRLPQGVTLVPVSEADVVLVSLDDTLPERYAFAVDVEVALRDAGSEARTVVVDGVTVMALIPVR